MAGWLDPGSIEPTQFFCGHKGEVSGTTENKFASGVFNQSSSLCENRQGTVWSHALLLHMPSKPFLSLSVCLFLAIYSSNYFCLSCNFVFCISQEGLEMGHMQATVGRQLQQLLLGSIQDPLNLSNSIVATKERSLEHPKISLHRLVSRCSWYHHWLVRKKVAILV